MSNITANKTYQAKNEEVQQNWYVINAEGLVLGRLAAEVAKIITGKHKPTYTKHCDTGDFVVVINADKIKLTGNKLNDKMYYSHSGYPGGMKSKTAQQMMDSKPEDVIKDAVWGMIPKWTLGRQMFSKLKVYAGAEHPHSAQKPVAITLTDDVRGVSING